MERRDIPLDLVVLADLGLPGGHAAIGRARAIEPDALAGWMASLDPGVTLAAAGGSTRIVVTEPRGFRPEALVPRLPEAAALLELRRRLSQQGITTQDLEALIRGLPEASPLRQALRRASDENATGGAAPKSGSGAAPPAPSPAPAPAPGRDPNAHDTLDALFAMVDVNAGDALAPGSPAPVSPTTRALDMLVRGITAGGRGGAVVRSSTQRGLAAAVDEALAGTLRPVLHDPAFVALEQTWSGLRFLVRRVDHRSGIKIHVIPTTAKELAGHVRDVLVPFAEDQRREGRTVVAIADFDLGADPAGLAPLADAVAAVQVPLIAGLDPGLLGLDTLAGIERIENAAELLADADHGAWQALRSSEGSRWLFLAANRFLMRLPYGAEHDPVKAFAFEENPSGAPPFWLWGRPAWALGERIAASFVRCGWGVEVTGQDEDVPLGDLPVRMLTLKTGEEVPAPLEALLPERRALELSQGGIVTLLCRRGGDQAFLASAPCVHRASGTASSTAESRRDTLGFAMLVAQVSAGLARLLDVARGGAEVAAPALERLFADRDGPTLEVRAQANALSVTPYRGPVRGLPGFTIPLSSSR